MLLLSSYVARDATEMPVLSQVQDEADVSFVSQSSLTTFVIQTSV